MMRGARVMMDAPSSRMIRAAFWVQRWVSPTVEDKDSGGSRVPDVPDGEEALAVAVGGMYVVVVLATLAVQRRTVRASLAKESSNMVAAANGGRSLEDESKKGTGDWSFQNL